MGLLKDNSYTMNGTLYIVSTPIGNLEDLTFRALRILQEVSVIAAEDTRRTQKLCTHYGVRTTLTSYHDFNKEQKTPILLNRLEEGFSIALVSDAGTPLISDPGYYLLTQALAHNLQVVPIPGPSAVLTAISASGLPTDTFSFHGFLPRKAMAKTQFLQNLAYERGTIILFETPHRVKKTLDAIYDIFRDRRIVLMRELTKSHEEIVRGTVAEVRETCLTRTFKGEITLVLEGRIEKKNKKIRGPNPYLPVSE
ncbi:MAG: 16S rRNA (cytidine(1402)-2'-O)-methyltransferase [Nitrospirales bacterium]|nr:16S rRNA (cytidine(1402)-2'-O)-methyltransferase [Nitrospirales bacterium]